MKAWQEVRIEVNQEVEEALYALLAEFGAQGVAVDDPSLVDFAKDAGLGDYFPDAVQDGRIRMTCYFPDHKGAAELAKLKADIAGLVEYGLNPGEILLSTGFVQEEDWAHAWKQYYHSLRIGRIVIQPSWEDAPEEVQDQDVVIVLDPGMAFGTGTHPTTSMCLEFLQELDLTGKTVWDVGTGSGILAIACAKLGARVEAVDVDATAVRTSAENRDLNHVSFTVNQGSIESLKGSPDIIVANIIADVIVDILPQVAAALTQGGLFVAGGIIQGRAEDVEAAARQCGLLLKGRREVQEWVGYCFAKE
ncbi:MAG TPA: 50S ribosomal protein L11 methyltransferase [Firmicutes bacterium]|nr:50S ribosomal protein L11 methyltransferase [Bacillota bacterium]